MEKCKNVDLIHPKFQVKELIKMELDIDVCFQETWIPGTGLRWRQPSISPNSSELQD